MANPDAHDRAQLAIAAYQAGREGLVTEMLTLSPQFAKMRAAHEAGVRGPILKRIHHSSQAGPPELECQARRPAPACPDSTRASAAEQSFGSAAGQPPDDRKPARNGGYRSVRVDRGALQSVTFGVKSCSPGTAALFGRELRRSRG
jgi:hypothetical protein